MIEPASADPKIILSPYSYPIPIEDPITGEFYYSQTIVLDTSMPEHWNGLDSTKVTVNGERTFNLLTLATPQNDAPYDINQISSNITSYNQNSYEWESSEIEINIWV